MPVPEGQTGPNLTPVTVTARSAFGARGAPLGAATPTRASRCIGLANHHHERLNQIFDAMDADKSGEITPAEFIDHLYSRLRSSVCGLL